MVPSSLVNEPPNEQIPCPHDRGATTKLPRIPTGPLPTWLAILTIATITAARLRAGKTTQNSKPAIRRAPGNDIAAKSPDASAGCSLLDAPAIGAPAFGLPTVGAPTVGRLAAPSPDEPSLLGRGGDGSVD
jgi:hypothetical protein